MSGQGHAGTHRSVLHPPGCRLRNLQRVRWGRAQAKHTWHTVQEMRAAKAVLGRMAQRMPGRGQGRKRWHCWGAPRGQDDMHDLISSLLTCDRSGIPAPTSHTSDTWPVCVVEHWRTTARGSRVVRASNTQEALQECVQGGHRWRCAGGVSYTQQTLPKNPFV